MNQVIPTILKLLYFIYTLFPVYLIINFFRYFGSKISLYAFVFSPHIGKDVRIMGGVYVDSRSEIGDFTYISGDFFGMNHTKILRTIIGKYCSIAQNFLCLPDSHVFDSVSTYPFSNLEHTGNDILSKSITIGNDVWIGANVTILGGVVVENGAVIGAGSIVTKDVPAYTIVVGVPAKVLKKRFSNDQIEKLQKISWWDSKNDELIKDVKIKMPIEKFIKKYER
jgi:virginiamycin A acetyltransferase